MALTEAQLLDQVETAISAILAGAQSYTIEGFTYTRASLQTLRDMRKEIKQQIANEGGSRRLAEF